MCVCACVIAQGRLGCLYQDRYRQIEHKAWDPEREEPNEPKKLLSQ